MKLGEWGGVESFVIVWHGVVFVEYQGAKGEMPLERDVSNCAVFCLEVVDDLWSDHSAIVV